MAYISTVLYETGGNLRVMSASQLEDIQALAAYLYQQNPIETLTVVGSGGNLSPSMTNRRYQAGAAAFTSGPNFASEAATPDISAIDETYDRVSKTRVSSAPAAEPEENGSNTAFPVYWDGATKTIRSMTKQDFFDTFIGNTITNGLVGTSGISRLSAGTYTVLTLGSSVSGNPGTSIVSSTPIFVDKRADADLYTAAGIEETQDQPETINNYYLHKVQQTSKPSYQTPLFMRSDASGVQVYTTANFEDLVGDYILSATFGLAGYSISHEIGTSVSNQKGSSMNDTYLSGSSAAGYTQYKAASNDYRTQEFPNGAVAILNSYKLGISTTFVGESVSLEGTTGSPENHTSSPVSDGTVEMGWRFNSSGTVEDYDSDRAPQYSATGHASWNNSTPSGTWYIRATVESDTGNQTHSNVGTWLDLTASSRLISFTDTTAAASYGTRQVVYKIEISRNNDGSNIAATGYYETSYDGGA